MVNNELLRRDVRFLGDMLGEVIVENAGDAGLQLVQRIRELARDRRGNEPGAEAQLADRIAALTEPEIRIVARALSVFFDLSNLAEDRHRVRVLRERERERHPAPIGESIGAAIAELKAAGLSGEAVQQALDALDIDLVFTAHPSEAKRRSVRSKLRRMRQGIKELDREDLLPRERNDWHARLRADMTVLWQTEFLRPSRPTVLEEVERGLSIMPRLWETVPAIFSALREALAIHYPDHEFPIHDFLQFGSWVGGDRDGHPDVTWDVTQRTLLWLRDTAIDRHLEKARQVYDFVTIADEGDPCGSLAEKIAAAISRWPAYAATIARVGTREIFRRWVKLIEWRLQQSRIADLQSPPHPGGYRSGIELEQDIAELRASLRGRLGAVLPATEVQRWLDLTRVFGLHLTRLDVRQDARRYREIMTEIFAQWGVASRFGALEESDRQSILTRTLGSLEPIREPQLSPLGQDTLRLFRLLYTATERLGPSALGGHVISMTRYPSDVLTVLWLWHRAGRERAEDSAVRADLPIIPLFEKIGDLQGAPETLSSILEHPVYADYLRHQGNRQIVMVGYSDSTKDGGYLAACWGLYQAQDHLHRVAAQRGVKLTFFHGRGGSLGRGGGPAARGILSLPADALGGALRLTEQGEVLAERYDDIDVAYRHLEQVTWATLVASNLPRPAIKADWTALMQSLAQRSLEIYRELVEQPGFIAYFEEATPIEEIENLPIASRPSRRTGQRTLADLRAIPWVFAWTQNRCLLPAWYGLGTALTEVKYGDRSGWQTVCEMYRQWPFFQATIDNAALALAKADMYIGQRYSELNTCHERRQRIWMLLAAERDRSRQAILDIVGGSELLASTPWFQGSIEVRNPSIDPLNLIQIELLRRRRGLPADAPAEEHDRLRDLLRLTVQGIAAGMRTTG